VVGWGDFGRERGDLNNVKEEEGAMSMSVCGGKIFRQRWGSTAGGRFIDLGGQCTPSVGFWPDKGLGESKSDGCDP